MRAKIRRRGMTPPALPSQLKELVRYDAQLSRAASADGSQGADGEGNAE